MKTLIRLTALLAVFLAAITTAQEVEDAFRRQVEEVLKAFEAKKYDEVVAKIDAIPSSGEASAFLLNLKGAALTKLQNYDAAKSAFEQALEASPGLFAATFNLGEILFLQRDFQKAQDWFEGMLRNDPRNELLQFKVLLCQIQLGDTDGARRTLSRMKFPGETPAWHFSQAAWEISRGNKNKAADYLKAARTIFPGKTEIYEETFADLGLKTK